MDDVGICVLMVIDDVIGVVIVMDDVRGFLKVFEEFMVRFFDYKCYLYIIFRNKMCLKVYYFK